MVFVISLGLYVISNRHILALFCRSRLVRGIKQILMSLFLSVSGLFAKNSIRTILDFVTVMYLALSKSIVDIYNSQEFFPILTLCTQYVGKDPQVFIAWDY